MTSTLLQAKTVADYDRKLIFDEKVDKEDATWPATAILTFPVHGRPTTLKVELEDDFKDVTVVALFAMALKSHGGPPALFIAFTQPLRDIEAPVNFTLKLDSPKGGWSIQRLEKESDGTVIVTPLTKRPEPTLLFPSYDLNGVAEYIKKHDCRKIIVMAGAGISVAAGIPDFRTPGTGLYANLQKYNLPYPEAIFSMDYLRQKPEAFVAVATDMKLWPGSFAPTHIHHFMKALQDAGRLLRVFTQNVDCLERCAGVNPDLIVEAHGTFAGATCIEKGCRKVADVAVVRQTMEAGTVPRCVDCGGIVKPDVVFFGEALPKRFFERMEEDSAQADLLIIVGTSLKVFPFAGLADVVAEECPRVLINNEEVGDFTFYPGPEAAKPILYRDVFLSGDAQQTVKALAAGIGLGDVVENAYAAGVEAVKKAEEAKLKSASSSL